MYAFTLGFLFVGWLYDLCRLNSLVDEYNRREDEAAAVAAVAAASASQPGAPSPVAGAWPALPPSNIAYQQAPMANYAVAIPLAPLGYHAAGYAPVHSVEQSPAGPLVYPPVALGPSRPDQGDAKLNASSSQPQQQFLSVAAPTHAHAHAVYAPLQFQHDEIRRQQQQLLQQAQIGVAYPALQTATTGGCTGGARSSM